MRYNEEMVQPKKEPKPEKKEEVVKAGSPGLRLLQSWPKNKPMLGGNSFGGS